MRKIRVRATQMQKLLLATITATLLVFSTATFAGGAHCDSMKKGHDKDMSAEMEQFKHDHGWLFSNGHDDLNASQHPDVDLDMKKEVRKVPDSKLIES